jgi:hypothetical protein
MADTSDLSRRRFLQTGALVAGGAASAALTPVALWSARPAVRRLRRLTGPSLKGEWIEPGDPGYEDAAQPNNLRWAGVLPLAIAMCADDQDVQKSIQWARDNNKEFAIRSGGHSYAGFSTTTGVLIDVKRMKRVTVKNDGTVVVQGGANNQDVATALRSGQFAVPSGRCPTVGTSGLVLGGGWGFSATHSGLTCDSLRETEVVLADGSLVTASDKVRHDLFWAIRGGGGGNFGVHTSFTFNLVPVSDVTTFNIVWAGGPGRHVQLLTSLQHLQADDPTTISTRTKVRPLQPGANPTRAQLVVETLGLYWGKESHLRDALAPTFRIQKPESADIRESTYWDARDYLVTDDPHGRYDLRSSYVEEKLSEDALNTMLTWMTKWPGGALTQENMGILFAIGGKVKTIPSDKTAYVHRNSNYIFEMERAWNKDDTQPVLDLQAHWLTDYYEAMKKYVQPESYVNFPNRDLKDWAQQYYGSNLARLEDVKSKYDKDNVFKFQQSIPLKKKP